MHRCFGQGREAASAHPRGNQRGQSTGCVRHFRARTSHIRDMQGLDLVVATHFGECDMPLWSKEPKNKKAEPPKAQPQPPKVQAEPPKPKVAEKAVAKPAEVATEKELSSADMQKRREVSARLLMRFGEVVSVMMRAQQFRDLPLKHLQELVVPPLMSGQFLVAEAQSKAQGFVTPVAAALWARVSKEVDQRLSENLD